MLKFKPGFFQEDPDCAIMFVKLQHYRHYSKEEFDASGDASDSILCIMKQYREKEVEWNDRYTSNAIRNFIEVEKSLDQFETNCRYWLYDNFVNNINEMDEKDEKNDAENNPETKDSYAMLMHRMNDGLGQFKMIAKIKEDIIKRLKAHIFHLPKIMNIDNYSDNIVDDFSGNHHPNDSNSVDNNSGESKNNNNFE
jgi:hypothetical protein